MLQWIEEENSWDFLKTSQKPIAIYGMGDGAEKIIAILKQYGKEPAAIFASDSFVRGHSFLGRKVLTYHEVCDKYIDFTVLLAFAIHDEPMLQYIAQMNTEHRVLAPDIPVAGDGLFTREFVKKNEQKFDAVYEKLADKRSKEVYLNLIRFKISGKVKYLYESTDTKGSIYQSILPLHDHESILDLGAYDGDTLAEFLQVTDGAYQHIIAVEPDEKNFIKLTKNTATLTNITRLQLCAWHKQTTLTFEKKAGRNSRLGKKGVAVLADTVAHMVHEPITLLKMDVEGAELSALCGAQCVIARDKPKLYVCAYHRNEDMFSLPLKIWEIEPSYQLYFRHSPYIPAWESNFYGIISRE